MAEIVYRANITVSISHFKIEYEL